MSDQQDQCAQLGIMWGESPSELWQWWLDAEEDGSTWASFFRDMVEYAPRRSSRKTGLYRLVAAAGNISYRAFMRRLELGWTLEEALRTPPRQRPASQAAARASAGASSRDNLRKANASRAAARSQR